MLATSNLARASAIKRSGIWSSKAVSQSNRKMFLLLTSNQALGHIDNTMRFLLLLIFFLQYFHLLISWLWSLSAGMSFSKLPYIRTGSLSAIQLNISSVFVFLVWLGCDLSTMKNKPKNMLCRRYSLGVVLDGCSRMDVNHFKGDLPENQPKNIF